MGRFSRLGNALYEGDVSVDFVGRKWLWYAISGVILVACIGGLAIKGLELGIEFKGGTQYTVSYIQTGQNTQDAADEVKAAVQGTGIDAASEPTVVTTGDKALRVSTKNATQSESDQIKQVIARTADVSESRVSEQAVGPSYGEQVAQQALTALIVFLVLVVLFIWAYFREWKMSVAALVALAHDVLITIGVYALSGFEVTPATVTGLLTILGFSLYDTVVVFDKVRENTKNLKSKRTTYAAAANLAVNQTLVRSINTSIVALLPVAAILYVGVTTLGAGDLKDLALSLFVGMAAGTYSSIFVATPLVVQLKSNEKAVTEAERRAKARQRRDVDRYASVPVFSEDMPIAEEPTGADDGLSTTQSVEEEPLAAPARVRRPEATGSGRVAPESKGPVTESRASGRQQPNRQPRSKRGRK
ncbi:protein translocase subunit SecF [Nocardioides mangrovicus]|uniref:Protein-export membrane protein SecF n=1 Tax=Nocardioides mangrovicus TaxID=2478913 RepID=A0A3L8P461_9ACTN|nr:protein translocase subunit SecF [Nocardioides mangrovicus]RLV50190.1 protein translocase subunit SecF [Nocardioides mangrovicus]